MERTWSALRALTDRLVARREELALLEVAVAETSAQVYAQSTETSVSGRDREASAATQPYRGEIIKLRAKIAGDEDMRDLLTLAIQSNVDIVGSAGGNG